MERRCSTHQQSSPKKSATYNWGILISMSVVWMIRQFSQTKLLNYDPEKAFKTYQFYLVTCIVSCRKITALNSAFREVWWRSLRKNEQNRSSQHVIHRQKIVRKSLQIIHTTFESLHEVSQNLVRIMILAKPTRPTSWFKLEPLYICLSCWRSPSQKGHQPRIAR